MKNDSLFNYGMRPVIYSKKKHESEQLGWFRGGFNISYFKNQILRESQEKKTYYTLQFSYKFENANDTVYFAHCYPYTYSDLNTYLTNIMNQNEINKICQRKKLCQSLAKNKCEILTITSPQKVKPMPNSKPKQMVIIMARQHPGETPGSWMMEGVIDFLVHQKNEEASYLREKCIFKIIPMVNPDGVIHGNYRTDLSGVDLNRNWFTPSKEYLTTIYAIKQLITQISKDYKIRYIIDLHGHSKKMNAFFYGNPNEEDVEEPRIFPLTCCQETQYIDFQNCTFRLEPSKTTTARISLFNQLFKNQKTNILTLEASFYGWISKNQEKNHFTIDQYKDIGAAVCKSMYKLYKQEEEYEQEIQKHIQEQQQKLNEENRNNPQSDKRQVIDIQIYKSMNVYERLFRNFKCDVQSLIKKSILKDTSKSKDESSGSDSDPLVDELTVKETKSMNSTTVRTKKYSFNIKNNNKNIDDQIQKSQPLSNSKNQQNGQDKTKSENSSPRILNQYVEIKNFEVDEIKNSRNTKSQNSISRNISIAIQTDFQDWLSRQNSLYQFCAKQQEDEETIDMIDISDIKNGTQNNSNLNKPNQINSYYQQNQMRGSSVVESCYKKEVKQFKEFITNSHTYRQSGAKSEAPQYRKNSYWQQAYNSKAQKMNILNNEMNSMQQNFNQFMNFQNTQNQSNNFQQIKLNNDILFQNNVHNQNYRSISTSPMRDNKNNNESFSPYFYGLNTGSNNNQIENNKNDEKSQQNEALNNSILKQSHLYKTVICSPNEENQNLVIQISKNTYKMAKLGQSNLTNNVINLNKNNDIGPQATQLQFSVRSDQKKFKGAYHHRNLYSRQNQQSTSQYLEDGYLKQNFKSQKIMLQDMSTQTQITLQTISKFQKSAPIMQFISNKNKNKTNDNTEIQQNHNFNQNLRNSQQKVNNSEKNPNLVEKKNSDSQEQQNDLSENINGNCKAVEYNEEINISAKNQSNNQVLTSNPSPSRGNYKMRKTSAIQNRSLINHKQYISQTQRNSPEDRIQLIHTDKPQNIQLNKHSATSFQANRTSINKQTQNQNSLLNKSQNYLENFIQNNKQDKIQDYNQNSNIYDINSNQQTNKQSQNITPVNLTYQNPRGSDNKSQQCITNSTPNDVQPFINVGINNKNYPIDNIVQLINIEQQFQNQLNLKQNPQNNVMLNKSKLMQMINNQFLTNTQTNISNMQGNEFKVKGTNIKVSPNQSLNLQQIGIEQNKNIILHQKQITPIVDMDTTKKDSKNLLQKNKYQSNNNQTIQSQTLQNTNQNKDKVILNNKIKRSSKNGRSISMNNEYLIEQQLISIQANDQIQKIINQSQNQNENENFKSENTSNRKGVSRRNSILNKKLNNEIELSQSYLHDPLISERQTKLKTHNIQQNQNYDSYNVPLIQTNYGLTQNIQMDQNQVSGQDLNQPIIISQTCPQSYIQNLESNDNDINDIDILDFIKQQKAIIKNNNTQNTQINNSSNKANKSMKIAHVQRQSRKTYNSPFNQRFIEKMIN